MKLRTARHLLKVPPWPERAGLRVSRTRSELWLPRAELASCVRAVIARDTRGVPLADAERGNHFPAAPTCALMWVLHGECSLQQPPMPTCSEGPDTDEGRHPGRTAAPLPLIPAVSVCGPFSRPTQSWNPGEMHAFMVLLMPDALHLLTGLDVAALMDRIVPAAAVLDASWQALLQQVQAASDDEQRVAAVEAFLLPRWRQRRPAEPLFSHRLADWSRGLALRAASSSLGHSLRQAQRRIKRWTGQTQRRLQGLQRSEQAFFHVAGAAAAAQQRQQQQLQAAPDWSDVAAHNGYADQSHLCRETRRVTGFAPEDLRRRMFTDESLWAYRLWALGVEVEED